MLKFPKVPHFLKINLIKLRKVKSIASKVIALLLAHKILILILILLSLVVAVLIQLRNNYISQLKIDQVESSQSPVLSFSPVPENIEIASDSASSRDTSVLGITTEEKSTYKPIYYPRPSPVPTPTYTPIPQPTNTPTPVSLSSNTSSTSSSSSNSSAKTCASLGTSPGIPTAWYSQASTQQTVGSTATINIELRDCNNNIAPVSDTLTITQSSGPGTTVNGNSPPISIEARNGQVSFTVKSLTSGTAVYIVRDTTKSFNVTDPNNKHPQVTFTISTPSPTPTSTPSPSPSPSSSSTPIPTVTPTPSSTPSPSPTSSATATPSPSPI